VTDPPMDAVLRAVRSTSERADTYTDLVHDPATDVSDARRPSPAETEVLDLLHLPHPRAYVRLSNEWWAIVDEVADALAIARYREEGTGA
jgi:hypothetical protein